jgi:uncharacterized protein YgiM (DUF1202 family)
MKQRHIWVFFILAIVQTTVSAEQVLYVQSAKANLMTGPGFDTKLIRVLEKGESVTVVQQPGTKEKARWIQVHYQSSDGWVAKLLLANQPPMDKVSILKGNEEQLEKSTRRRASSNVTAAATRGLRNEDRTRMSNSGQPDYNQLQEMEAVEVKEAEVREFHKEGLGQ